MISIMKNGGLVAKEEANNFERVLKERLPTAEQSSRAMQNALGIEPGTKLIGRVSVMLWEFPEPPPDTMQNIMARLESSHSISQQTTVQPDDNESSESDSGEADESDADEEVDSEDGDDSDSDSQGASELLWYPHHDDGNGLLSPRSDDYGELASFTGASESESETSTVDTSDEAENNIMSDQPLKQNDGTETKKRKRQESPGVQTLPHSSTTKKPKIVDADQEDDSEDDDESESDSQGADELLWNPGQGTCGYDTDESIEDVISESGSGTSSVDVSDDDEENRVPSDSDQPPKQNVNTDTKRGKSPESPLPELLRLSSTAKKPEIVVDLTGSPENNIAAAVHLRSKLQLQPTLEELESTPKTSNKAPASPPPLHQEMPRDMKTIRPVYWQRQLTMNVLRWLEQEGTRSSQTDLEHVQFRGATIDGRCTVFFNFNADGYAKVKVTRLILPPSAQSAMAPPKLLDWLVIEVSSKKGKYALPKVGNDKATVPVTFNKFNFPYSVFAFPLQAITNATIEHQQPSGSPLQPQRCRNSSSLAESESQPVIATSLMLGRAGRIPFLHGRNVNPKFAGGFMTACAEGKGVIEMKSAEHVPLKGLFGRE